MPVPFVLLRRLLLLLPIPILLLGGAVPDLLCGREDFVEALWLWYNWLARGLLFRSAACSLSPDGLSLIECKAKRVYLVEERDLVEMFTKTP